jgi:hypothetical protein
MSENELTLAIDRALAALKDKSSVLWTYWQNRLYGHGLGTPRPELINHQTLDELLDDLFYCEKWPGI